MLIKLLHGDCLVRLASMAEESVGVVCCDPPYGLEFMGKEWDRLDGVGTGGASFTTDGMGKGFKALPSYSGAPNPLCLNCGGSKRGRDRKGFRVCRCDNPEFPNIGREQGRGMQEWHARWLAEAFRVLVPGGVAKVFGGTRVYHRLAAAMADVGFTDIRFDAWTYGSGFPKSLNVAKALDKHLGVKPEVIGTVQSRNPHAQASDWGNRGVDNWRDAKRGTQPMPVTRPGSQDAALWDGWGTALKPAWEPILIGTKPC